MANNIKRGTLTDKSGKDHTDNFNAYCEMALNDGHNIVVLRETYERVWLTIDGMKTAYDKLCVDNRSCYAFTLKTLALYQQCEQAKRDGRL